MIYIFFCKIEREKKRFHPNDSECCSGADYAAQERNNAACDSSMMTQPTVAVTRFAVQKSPSPHPYTVSVVMRNVRRPQTLIFVMSVDFYLAVRPPTDTEARKSCFASLRVDISQASPRQLLRRNNCVMLDTLRLEKNK